MVKTMMMVRKMTVNVMMTTMIVMVIITMVT